MDSECEHEKENDNVKRSDWHYTSDEIVREGTQIEFEDKHQLTYRNEVGR
jgi:hypothetical protein